MTCSRFGLGFAFAAAALALAACSKRAPEDGAQDGGGGAAGNSAGQSGSAGSAGTAGPGVAGQGGTGGAAGRTDTAGTTGTSGAAGTTGTTSTAGAAGTAGDAGTSGSAGASGFAGSGTGVAGGGGAGGSAAGTGGPGPRLLVADLASNRFVAYDRYGQIVHDYASQLDFGSGFTSRTVDVGGVPDGLDGTRERAVIFITAQSTPAGTTKLRMVGIDGQLAAEHSVAGAWDWLGLSPKNGYLYATRSVFDSGDIAAVFRVADSSVVWQGGPIAQVIFPRDGEPLVYVPFDRAMPIRLVDLATATDSAPALTQPVFALQPGVWVTLVASTGARMVLQTDGVGRYGRLLWSMDWQARITRFGATMPEYTDEYFLGFDPTETKAVWQSQTNGNDGQPIVYVGAYQIDFASGLVGPFSGTTECFGRPSQSTFKIDSGAVQSCPCSGAACSTIATLPALENGWTPSIQRSADGNALLITYGWARNAAPRAPFPDIKCFSASGAVLATLPYGTATMDPTGQIVLYREVLATTLGRTGIVNLATGNVAWINPAPMMQFGYE